MTGTIVVRAEQPGLGRAGTFSVVVGEETVGRVDQGTTARFPVAVGTHTIRVVGKDRSRSNTATVEVAEGQDVLVTAQGTGLKAAVLLPLLAGVSVPPIYVVASIALIGALFYAVPGLLFRVRAAVGDAAPPATRGPHTPEEEHSGTSLWWETDPALAKRFRKDATS
ncbi:hypothetical protein ABZY44_18635 [Streptomyces sp. NPDC006544]|uniref:hypothetical protein n=1 Tax=Streptomyces sp. NPDC006544 TaxID=3154583 RepID=UPI0033B7C92D